MDEKLISFEQFKKKRKYDVSESIQKIIDSEHVEPFFKRGFEEYLIRMADSKTYSSELQFINCIKADLENADNVLHIQLKELIDEV